MPTLQKLFYLDVTPEKFIDNCSDVELREAILLANTRLNRIEKAPAPPKKGTQPLLSTKSLPKPAKQMLRKRIFMTPEEEAMLRELWPNTSGKEIAEKLNREYKALMSYAARLGLRKNNKRNPDTRQQRQTTDEPEEPTPVAPPEPKHKRMISVRVDKRTIVQVPEGTDVEEVKKKYKHGEN